VKTFNIRIFNVATGQYKPGSVTIGPRRYDCGYVYSRRSRCFIVIHDRVEVRVVPSLFRNVTGKAPDDIAGQIVLTADELRLLGFVNISA